MENSPMNADCAFWIGSTHRVCQDYAVSGHTQAAAHAVLADGCSGSPDTDIGARLLAKSAQHRLPLCAGAIENAANCAGALGLPPACLDATLLTLTAADGTFTARCWGDGVVALGRHDGTVEAFVVSFAASYPHYLSYTLDADRRRLWLAQPGNAKTVTRWLLGTDSLPETQPGERDCEQWTGSLADCRFVAVLSDGVQSFTQSVATDTSRTTQAVPVADVLPLLLAFKGGQGQFVQRRVRAFQRECAARGWTHADDISLAVVWLA